MFFQKKVEGFTMIETLISMMLSSFVIAISYYLLTSIYHQFYLYKETSSLITSYNEHTYKINRELFHSDKILWKDQKLRLVKKNDTLLINDLITNNNLSITYLKIDTIQRSDRQYYNIELELSSQWSSNRLKFIKELY